MSFKFLIGLLCMLLALFVILILRLLLGFPKEDGKKAPKRRATRTKQVNSSEKQGEIDIKVRREADGIHLILREGTVPENPEDDEEALFPDLLNISDGPEDSTGLSDEFWMEIANLPHNPDPADRERLAAILAGAGLIQPDEVAVVAAICEMEEPEAEEGVDGEREEATPASAAVKPEPVPGTKVSDNHPQNPDKSAGSESRPEAPIPHPTPDVEDDEEEKIHDGKHPGNPETPEPDDFDRHVFNF